LIKSTSFRIRFIVFDHKKDKVKEPVVETKEATVDNEEESETKSKKQKLVSRINIVL
jgi:hypothetical protein